MTITITITICDNVPRRDCGGRERPEVIARKRCRRSTYGLSERPPSYRLDSPFRRRLLRSFGSIQSQKPLPIMNSSDAAAAGMNQVCTHAP